VKGVAFHAIIGGARFVVRAAKDDEPGAFTLVLGEQLVAVHSPEDLLSVADRASCDFGAFSLTLWKQDGRTRYRASSGGVAGPDAGDEERACWGLLDVLGDAKAPRACFFCRWSDVEPSTGWGNLGCAVKHAREYDEIATSADARRRKWGAQGLLDWVDEWFACDRFEVRPRGYGYRGRP
jgi:hypothetical protein